MTTVLFADRDGAAFGPLGERTVPALLPLQSVPALERALEALVAAGIRSALLVTGPRAAEVERRFGKGIRWGVALEYVRREDGESSGDVLRRVEPRLDGDTLALRGDAGTHAAIGEFVAAVNDGRGAGAAILAGVSGGRPLGLWRVKPGALKKLELPRDPKGDDWRLGADQTPLELAAAGALLDGVAAYRAADRAEKPSVSPRAEVDPKTVLGPGTTVAEDARVLEGAHLTETSVLPRTVIPAGVSVSNAVVSGNLVVDAATGAVSALSDQLPPRPASAAPSSNRIAGALAFVLSLPLWPVAFGWSLVANAGHATRDLTLSGNGPGADPGGRPKRSPFRTFRFETAVPVLRDLPLLLAVASGKLALFGVAPMTPQEEGALTEAWERVRLEMPAGLLSLSRLVAPASAPAEVPRLLDAFQARGGSAGLLALGLKSLFSASGWTAKKEWNPDLPPEASSS